MSVQPTPTVVQYLAQIKALLELWFAAMEPDRPPSAIFNRLEAVERYARQMSVPSNVRSAHQLLLDAMAALIAAYVAVLHGQDPVFTDVQIVQAMMRFAQELERVIQIMALSV